MVANTKAIAIHLNDIHYSIAIVCNVWQYFDSMNTRTSWITIPVAKSSATGNAWNRRDRKRQRNYTRRSKSPGERRRCLKYPALRSPKDHTSRMPLNTFCAVQLDNVSWCPFWSILDLPSFISWVHPHSTRQTVISFFRCNVYEVMMPALTILSYVSI